jgi:Flp pilus assembly protein TadG
MTLFSKPGCLRGSERGQAVPEFALVAPILFLILFAIIQFGFTLSGQIGFTNGVREAARYASTVPNASAASVEAELRSRSLPKSIPGFSDANFDGPATVVSYCAYTNPNHTASTPSYSIKVRVTATYKHSLFLPLVSEIVDRVDGTIDGRLTATVTEEMRIENPRLTTAGGLSACP